MKFPIDPRQAADSSWLAYWEDFLTEEDISLLLSRPEWNFLYTGRVGGASGTSEINQDVRRSKVSGIEVDDQNRYLWKKFSDVVAEVNKRFFHFDITGFYEHAQIASYSGDYEGHYDWHTDACPNELFVPRKLSMALLLSDPSEFEGGLLQIKDHSDEAKSLSQKKGRAWFFPSWALHRVTPVTSGERKSLVLWAGGPQFR